MANKQFSEAEILAKVAKIEQSLTEVENEIEEKHLYDDNAKLTTIKAKFASIHLKLQQYREINEQEFNNDREK